MLSVSVFDHTNLEGRHKKIIEAAEKGVEAATQESVEWIKDEVITGGAYVGHQYYPDVTATTKRIKAKKGQTVVLVGETKNYLSSWDGKTRNMVGIITGGGKDYHAKLHDRGWRLDLLWEQVHKKDSEKIIKQHIKKAI